MFDIGFSELLIIAVVALLVLGPERLPRAARLAGMWVRKARAQWYSVQADLEREIAQEEYRRSVGKPLAELERELAEQAQALRRDLEAADAGIVDPAREAATRLPLPDGHPRESGDPRPPADEPAGPREPAP
jgi:sec-independent protein translocase protein TatB